MEFKPFTLPDTYMKHCFIIDSHPDLLEVFVRHENGRYAILMNPNEVSVSMESWFDTFDEALAAWQNPDTRTNILIHGQVKWTMADFDEAINRYVYEYDLEGGDRQAIDANHAALMPQIMQQVRFMKDWQDQAIQLGNEMIDNAVHRVLSEFLQTR